MLSSLPPWASSYVTLSRISGNLTAMYSSKMSSGCLVQRASLQCKRNMISISQYSVPMYIVQHVGHDILQAKCSCVASRFVIRRLLSYLHIRSHYCLHILRSLASKFLCLLQQRHDYSYYFLNLFWSKFS